MGSGGRAAMAMTEDHWGTLIFAWRSLFMNHHAWLRAISMIQKDRQRYGCFFKPSTIKAIVWRGYKITPQYHL
jgi:hypothetical protein